MSWNTGDRAWWACILTGSAGSSDLSGPANPFHSWSGAGRGAGGGILTGAVEPSKAGPEFVLLKMGPSRSTQKRGQGGSHSPPQPKPVRPACQQWWGCRSGARTALGSQRSPPRAGETLWGGFPAPWVGAPKLTPPNTETCECSATAHHSMLGLPQARAILEHTAALGLQPRQLMLVVGGIRSQISGTVFLPVKCSPQQP